MRGAGDGFSFMGGIIPDLLSLTTAKMPFCQKRNDPGCEKGNPYHDGEVITLHRYPSQEFQFPRRECQPG